MGRSAICLMMIMMLLPAGLLWAAGPDTTTPGDVQTMKPLQVASVVYHGNIKSHVFHRPGCRHYNCKNCTAVFNSREEAINSGYRACKLCKP